MNVQLQGTTARLSIAAVCGNTEFGIRRLKHPECEEEGGREAKARLSQTLHEQTTGPDPTRQSTHSTNTIHLIMKRPVVYE